MTMGRPVVVAGEDGLGVEEDRGTAEGGNAVGGGDLARFYINLA